MTGSDVSRVVPAPPAVLSGERLRRGDRVVVVAPHKDQLGETGVIIEPFCQGIWRVAFDTATRPCRDCRQGEVPLVKLMSATVLRPAQEVLL